MFDEDDFQDEIRSHLALAERDRVAEGEAPDAARLAARKAFGNVMLTTEAARRVWTPRWLEALSDVVSEIRQSARALIKSPAFSLIVIAVLAVGISLNATVFAVLKGMLITPLAGVAHSNELRVVMRETSGGRLLRLSYPDFRFLRDHDHVFSGLMGTMFRLEQYRLGAGAGSRPLSVEFVTGNYFRTLGVRAALGRTLLPSDELAPGPYRVAVIGHGLWQRDFGADPGIVGRTIQINRNPLIVVGVADAAFHGTVPAYDVEVFIPITMVTEIGVPSTDPARSQADLTSDRRTGLLVAHGFLRPGVSAADATAQTDAIWTALAPERTSEETNERLRVLRFWQSPIGPQTYIVPVLSTLSPMGALVLLIVCANISGLALARGVARRGEIAVRQALGATRTRIIRLLLVETLVLVVPGTALGLAIAERFLAMFLQYVNQLAAPQQLFFPVELDAITLAFAAFVAVLCAVVFGLLPALQTSRVDVVSVINEDGSSRGGARGRLRAALVVAQVAVSLVLLVGAGMVVRGLSLASHVNAGFDDQHVLAAAIDLQQQRYTEQRGRELFRELLQRVRAQPGVKAATLATYSPLAFIDTPTAPVTIDGRIPRRGEDVGARFNHVDSDYFQTLSIPLAAGRAFDDRDTDRAMPALIVNRTFAERFWGNAGNAIGRRVRVSDDAWRTIVGVAEDVKYIRLSDPPQLYYYLPLTQVYRPATTLYVRGATDNTAMASLRKQIATLDPDLVADVVQPLSDSRRVALMGYQIAAAMLFVFGATGLLLAAMGTYALVSYTVLQQRRAIGVRIAIGATALRVVCGFLGRGLRLAGVGAVIGLATALATVLALARALGSAPFGVNLTDPLSFAQAIAAVLGGVLVATLVPAWRAARANPVDAMRYQ